MQRHLGIVWIDDDHSMYTVEYLDTDGRTKLARATWSGAEWVVDHTNDAGNGFVELRRFTSRADAIIDLLQCATDGVFGPKRSISLRGEQCRVSIHPGNEPRGHRCVLHAGHTGEHK